MARTSGVVNAVGVVDDDLGMEKENKDDGGDRDNGKAIGSYRNASEKDCGCTPRYQRCILPLTHNPIHLNLATVAVFVIVEIVVVIYI